MTRYIVNATVTVAAWVEVDAEDEMTAFEEAREMRSAQEFEIDMGTATVDFNVTPAVEVA